MLAAVFAIVSGLVLLVWGADRFVEGAACAARHFRISPLLIGMVIIGFGTSMPELMVSAIASVQGNSGLVLGNAYGSNIANIALILGLTSLLKPIAVQSRVLHRELPILIGVTVLAGIQLIGGSLSRGDGWLLLAVFGGLMLWSVAEAVRLPADPLANEVNQEYGKPGMPLKKALLWTLAGLILLIGSSRILVWGAVVVARALGVGDLLIGLTIVAVGTSLPELASSLAAIRKGEHDMALGNILGSNLFNTLAVVGLAAVIRPMSVSPEIIRRDLPVMVLLTLALFLAGYGFRGRPGRINRCEGALLLAVFIGYVGILIRSALQ